MKRNWEYKKLGECGIVITGNTPSKKDAANYSSNDFCFVKPNDIEKDGITYINQTCEYISKKAFERSRRLSKGAVLTTCIGIIGKVAILEVDATCNQQINAIIPNADIDSKFLAYSILSLRNYLTQKANAPVVPIINKGDFSDVLIPIPPLEEQSRIVAELDLLTGIIDKQNAQLKELDNLAQAIFYDMFGDPIENPKRWDISSIKDLAEKYTDGPFGSNLKSEHYQQSGVRIIRLQNIGVNEFVDTDQAFISEEHYKKLEKYTCYPGDIVIGTLGEPNLRACIVPLNIEKAVNKADCVLCRVCKERISEIYLCRVLNNPKFVSAQCQLFSHGQTRARISAGQLKNACIPVPPLTLQQSFAEKIQSIEKQKETIRASIAETQKLLDYTMDKYFG